MVLNSLFVLINVMLIEFVLTTLISELTLNLLVTLAVLDQSIYLLMEAEFALDVPIIL